MSATILPAKRLIGQVTARAEGRPPSRSPHVATDPRRGDGEETAKRPRRGREEAAKRPRRGREEAAKRPRRGREEAAKRPRRGREEAAKRRRPTSMAFSDAAEEAR